MARPPVVWTRLAQRDVQRALEYLAREAQAPAAAARLLEDLNQAAASVTSFPDRGRIVPELGLPRRELLVGSYRLVYRAGKRVEILRLVHGRRNFRQAWRLGSRR